MVTCTSRGKPLTKMCQKMQMREQQSLHTATVRPQVDPGMTPWPQVISRASWCSATREHRTPERPRRRVCPAVLSHGEHAASPSPIIPSSMIHPMPWFQKRSRTGRSSKSRCSDGGVVSPVMRWRLTSLQLELCADSRFSGPNPRGLRHINPVPFFQRENSPLHV
jgi:hypothetical protein